MGRMVVNGEESSDQDRYAAGSDGYETNAADRRLPGLGDGFVKKAYFLTFIKIAHIIIKIIETPNIISE
jgi:hypothetical protein